MGLVCNNNGCGGGTGGSSSAAVAGWYLGNPGDSCDDICQRNGYKCNLDAHRNNVVDENFMEYVLTQNILQNSNNIVCERINGNGAPYAPFIRDLTAATGNIFCVYSNGLGDDLTCDSKEDGNDALAQRLCCCTSQEDVNSNILTPCTDIGYILP